MTDAEKASMIFALLARVSQGAINKPDFIPRLIKKLSPGAREFLEFLTELIKAAPFVDGKPQFDETALRELLDLQKPLVREIIKKGILALGKDIPKGTLAQARMYLEMEKSARNIIH